MEKMQWFKFSISEWKMGKIQRCTPEAKSSFMELCCLYWINETKLSIEDAIIECDEENYKNLLSKKVIKEVNGFIKIFFLDEQFENALNKSEKAKDAVAKRWAKRNTEVNQSNNESNTNVLQPNNESNTEENRIEKKKEEKEVPLTPKNKFSEDIFKFYEFYLKHFEDRYKPENESQKNKWLECIDKLIKIDGLTPREINDIILRGRNDEFWSEQFRTILKLRTKNKEGIPYWKIFNELQKNRFKQNILFTTPEGIEITDKLALHVYQQTGRV
jgi:hypothetical protein